MKKNSYTVYKSKRFIALAIIIFDDASLWFLGMSFVVIGIISLYLINH